MVTNRIKLIVDKVQEVKEFVELATTITEETILTRGGNISVDAKSIMGVFSFDTSQWFYLTFDKFVGKEVIEKFKKWEVK